MECVRVIVNQKRTLGLSGLQAAISLARERGSQQILSILQTAVERWVDSSCSLTAGQVWGREGGLAFGSVCVGGEAYIFLLHMTVEGREREGGREGGRKRRREGG